jgi:ATP-dependent protease HslVU (ClpYQ) peptidase subunit
MTTIVYKDGVIAWDSRVSAGGNIVNDQSNKCHLVKDLIFWCAGTTPDYGDFFRAYLGDKKTDRQLDVSAFVLDSGKLYIVGCEAAGLWRSEVVCERAIGSGSEFAIGAMDCGKSAKGALKIAAGRCLYTGGKLHSKRIFK